MRCSDGNQSRHAPTDMGACDARPGMIRRGCLDAGARAEGRLTRTPAEAPAHMPAGVTIEGKEETMRAQPRCSRSDLRHPIPPLVAGILLFGLLLIGGCTEEEDCPACPSAGIVIEQIFALPDTVSIGGSVQLWALAEGEDLEYRWSASAGEFLEIDTYYAVWKAPDLATIAEISVVAYNDEESAARVRALQVGPYRPRHEPAYSGVAYCGLECHDAEGHGANYATWLLTSHADAFDRARASGAMDDWCAQCHAVGYGDVDSAGWSRHNGGFDEVPIAALEGVQCESCHGPLSGTDGEILADHATRARGDFLLAIGSSTDPQGCGLCHEDYVEYPPHASSHAYVSEWEASGHARSADDPDAQADGCASCHTAQGFLTSLDEWSGEYGEALPLVCAACHDPHGSDHPANLRIAYGGSPGDVCRQCHSDADQGYPETPHAPQAQMFAGAGGYEYAGGSFASSLHQNVAQRGCVDCHFAAPAAESHSFIADPASCTACHPDASGSSFAWSDGMATVDSLLTVLREELDRATPDDVLTEAYARALFNWSFVSSDGSAGAHNFAYARDLLGASIEAFEPSEE
ncbi:MAG: hypothetical protein GF330_07060 [Candidatus Eisenbacteria bacterium]|nr:hypothetical protein [Candidatus Eisenbacteria bacterium]